MPPTNLTDDEWIPRWLKIDQHDQEEWLAFYFGIALKCDMPVLEALYFRAQPFLYDWGATGRVFNILENGVKVLLISWFKAQPNWRLERSILGTLYAIHENGSEMMWSCMTPDFTFYTRLKNKPGYLTFHWKLDGRKISLIQENDASDFYHRSFIQKENLASQLEECLFACISLCQSDIMQNDSRYEVLVAKRKEMDLGTPNFVDESNFGFGLLKRSNSIRPHLLTTMISAQNTDAEDTSISARRRGKIEQILRMRNALHCGVCDTPTTLNCSRCKKIRYCSRYCQKVDWDRHKQKCK